MRQNTILIADDDTSLLHALSTRCRQLGLDVHTATDALGTLNAVREHHPDLICLDVHMPGGNGLSACEMLASDPKWKSIPVIILTGSEAPSTIIRCHELCAYYVQKCPTVWPRLEPLICEILEIEPSDQRALSM